MEWRQALVLAGIGVAAGPVAAARVAVAPARSTTAVRADTAPRIDGLLDDEVWRRAPRAGGFTQRAPDEGQPATDSTAVQFAYDDEALYMAVMCYDDDPGQIAARLARRDEGLMNSDWVHLSLDANCDRQTAYSLFISAASCLNDAYYYDDDRQDWTWDGIWDGRSRIGEQGWSAEVRIPFSTLRFSPQEENVMGVNVDRYTLRKREGAFWVYVPRSEKGWVSWFGQLRGIRGLSPPRSREILPYAVARSTFAPRSAGGGEHLTNAGVDLRYGAASNISVNATVNPDFGQVEADPAVLNLSVFESFFEERRPFFLEGGQLFDTPLQLFYSRRIGRPPGRLPLPAGAGLLDPPESTTILGAAKVTGKTAGKTTFALMEAVAAEEHGTLAGAVAAGAAASQRRLLEPRANYLVGRLQQDVLAGNSKVGLIATAANRARSGSACAGGVDWNLLWQDNRYQLSGQLAGSRAERFGDGRQGLAGQVEAGLTAGRLEGSASYQTLSPGFDANDLGFIPRVDAHQVDLDLELRWFDNAGYFRRRFVSGEARSSWNYDGLTYEKEVEAGTSLELKSFWWVGAGVVRRLRTLDDLDTRGGPPIANPASTSLWAYVEADNRRPVSGEAVFEWERDGAGSTRRALDLRVDLRPSTRMALSLRPRYSWRRDDAQWVANADDDGDGAADHFVYGELDSRVVDVITRLDLVFTRDVTLQLYLQPFVAAGDYEGFKELARPRSYAFAPYDGLAADPDFRRRSLRGNLVLRWEYRPGSTLFLVWSQARQDQAAAASLRPWHNLRESLADGGTDVLFLKLSYWLSR